MSVLLHGYQLRALNYGTQVITSAKTLPATATATLFTVSSGAVIVTSLLGLVSTAIASSDPAVTIGTAPTTGTAEVAGIASSTVLSSAEVGTWITVQPSSGLPGALVVMASAAKAGNAVYLPAPFVVSAGTITWTTGATKTGAVIWYLTYIPLDTGASVA